MASITRQFAVAYVFGIRSRNLFGPVAARRQSRGKPTGVGQCLLGKNRGTGEPEKQWLRSMVQKHILLAVACPRGVIGSLQQAGPLRPVYSGDQPMDALTDSGERRNVGYVCHHRRLESRPTHCCDREQMATFHRPGHGWRLQRDDGPRRLLLVLVIEQYAQIVSTMIARTNSYTFRGTP